MAKYETKFLKGDRVVVIREIPYGYHRIPANSCGTLTRTSDVESNTQAWRVLLDDLENKHDTDGFLIHEQDFEHENIYNSPLYKALL